MNKTLKYNNFIGLIIILIFVPSKCWGYYFEGYFCPQVLVSPLEDDKIYTPVGKGIVTSKAGFRIHPVTGKGDFHSGVDLAATLNDKVYCLMDGYVSKVGPRGALGVAVEITHPYPNVKTIYGHLNAYSVRLNEPVQRGRVIGYAGSTGRSTGVHVHFTVIKIDTNEHIEPLQFLYEIPQYISALKKANNQAWSNFNNQKTPYQSKTVETANYKTSSLESETKN